jgi:hypothetical protein
MGLASEEGSCGVARVAEEILSSAKAETYLSVVINLVSFLFTPKF